MLNFNNQDICDAITPGTSSEAKRDVAVGIAEITKFGPTGGTNYYLLTTSK